VDAHLVLVQLLLLLEIVLVVGRYVGLEFIVKRTLRSAARRSGTDSQLGRGGWVAPLLRPRRGCCLAGLPPGAPELGPR
jgi:hypothetical protein